MTALYEIFTLTVSSDVILGVKNGFLTQINGKKVEVEPRRMSKETIG